MRSQKHERGTVGARALVTLLVVAVAVGVFLVVGGKAGVGPLRDVVGSADEDVAHRQAPDRCPLLGLEPSQADDPGLQRSGVVPNRPALAIKVENLPAARPQTGLSWADIVYEEPVEVFITRFIAVYQCRNASRVEPIRSARLTDPDVLRQFGHPLFGYAGAVPPVVRRVQQTQLLDVNFQREGGAYHRDESREAPHNLYTSTQELYAAANWFKVYEKNGWVTGAPDPVFLYSPEAPDGRRVGEVHLPFSEYSDVYWRWNEERAVFLRWHGTVPHTLSDGTQVSARNVVVQVVKIRMTGIHDVKGAESPEAISIGSGKAYIFRNGRVVVGRWKRPTLASITKFVDSDGDEIALSPGNTWVELWPSTLELSFD